MSFISDLSWRKMPFFNNSLVLTGIFYEVVWRFTNETWDAYVYFNANDVTVFEHERTFNPLHAYRLVSIEALRKKGKQQTGDYECGLNCEPPNYTSEVSICEQTKR